MVPLTGEIRERAKLDQEVVDLMRLEVGSRFGVLIGYVLAGTLRSAKPSCSNHFQNAIRTERRCAIVFADLPRLRSHT